MKTKKGVAGDFPANDSFPLFKSSKYWILIHWGVDVPHDGWAICFYSDHWSAQNGPASALRSLPLSEISEVYLEPNTSSYFRIYRGKEVTQCTPTATTLAAALWADAIFAALQIHNEPDSNLVKEYYEAYESFVYTHVKNTPAQAQFSPENSSSSVRSMNPMRRASSLFSIPSPLGSPANKGKRQSIFGKVKGLFSSSSSQQHLISPNNAENTAALSPRSANGSSGANSGNEGNNSGSEQRKAKALRRWTAVGSLVKSGGAPAMMRNAHTQQQNDANESGFISQSVLNFHQKDSVSPLRKNSRDADEQDSFTSHATNNSAGKRTTVNANSLKKSPASSSSESITKEDQHSDDNGDSQYHQPEIRNDRDNVVHPPRQQTDMSERPLPTAPTGLDSNISSLRAPENQTVAHFAELKIDIPATSQTAEPLRPVIVEEIPRTIQDRLRIVVQQQSQSSGDERSGTNQQQHSDSSSSGRRRNVPQPPPPLASEQSATSPSASVAQQPSRAMSPLAALFNNPTAFENIANEPTTSSSRRRHEEVEEEKVYIPKAPATELGKVTVLDKLYHQSQALKAQQHEAKRQQTFHYQQHAKASQRGTESEHDEYMRYQKRVKALHAYTQRKGTGGIDQSSSDREWHFDTDDYGDYGDYESYDQSSGSPRRHRQQQQPKHIPQYPMQPFPRKPNHSAVSSKPGDRSNSASPSRHHHHLHQHHQYVDQLPTKSMLSNHHHVNGNGNNSSIQREAMLMDFLRGRIASPTTAPVPVDTASFIHPALAAKSSGSSSAGNHRRGEDVRSPPIAMPATVPSSAPVVASNNSRPKKGYLARAFSSKNSFNNHSNQMTNYHSTQAQQMVPSSGSTALPSFSFFRSTSRSKSKQSGEVFTKGNGTKMTSPERFSSSEEETSTNNSSSHHHSSNSSRTSYHRDHPTYQKSGHETLSQSPNRSLNSLTQSQSQSESQHQTQPTASTAPSSDPLADGNAQAKENISTPEGSTNLALVDERTEKAAEQTSEITVNVVTNDTDRGAMKLDELDVSVISPVAPSFASANATSKPVVGDEQETLRNSTNTATAFASSNHKLFRVFDVLGDGSESDPAKNPLDGASVEKKEIKHRRRSSVSKIDVVGDVVQQHPHQTQSATTSTVTRDSPRSPRIPGRRTSLVALDAAGMDAAIATAQEHQRRAPQALLKPYDVLTPPSMTTASAGLTNSGNAGVINSNIRRRASIATTTPSLSGSQSRSRSFVFTPTTPAPEADVSPAVPAFPFTTTIQAVYSHRHVTLTLLTRAEVRQRLLSRPHLLPCRPGLQLSPVKQRPVPLETHAAAPAMSPRQRYLQQQAQQRAQLEVAAMTMNALAAELLDSDVYLCLHRSESLHLGLSAVSPPPTSLNALTHPEDVGQTPTDSMGNDPHVAEEWFYMPLSRLVTLDVDVKRSGQFRFLLTSPHETPSASTTAPSMMKTPTKTRSPTSASSMAHQKSQDNNDRGKNHDRSDHTHKVEACLYVRTLDVAPGPSLFASLIHSALLGDHRSRVLSASTEQSPIGTAATKPAQNAAAMRFRHQLQQQQQQQQQQQSSLASATTTTTLLSSSRAAEETDTAGYVPCLLQATSPEILPAWLQTLLHLHRTIHPRAH